MRGVRRARRQKALRASLCVESSIVRPSGARARWAFSGSPRQPVSVRRPPPRRAPGGAAARGQGLSTRRRSRKPPRRDVRPDVFSMGRPVHSLPDGPESVHRGWCCRAGAGEAAHADGVREHPTNRRWTHGLLISRVPVVDGPGDPSPRLEEWVNNPFYRAGPAVTPSLHHPWDVPGEGRHGHAGDNLVQFVMSTRPSRPAHGPRPPRSHT